MGRTYHFRSVSGGKPVSRNKSYLFRYELQVVVKAPTMTSAWEKFDRAFPSLVKDRMGGIVSATPMKAVKLVTVK